MHLVDKIIYLFKLEQVKTTSMEHGSKKCLVQLKAFREVKWIENKRHDKVTINEFKMNICEQKKKMFKSVVP